MGNQTAYRLAQLREDLQRLVLAGRTLRANVPPRRSSYGSFGESSVVVPPARVVSPQWTFIGDRVTVLEHSWLAVVKAFEDITPRLEIGSGTRIGRFATIACVGSVTIAEDVLMSDGVFIGDTYHRYDQPAEPVITQPMSPPRPVEIGAGSFIGIRATVLDGVTVGRQAYVGAGAVVTEDVPDFCVAVGNPARIVRRS